MNKIKEFIESIDYLEGFEWDDIERIMKEYAEWYAKYALEIYDEQSNEFTLGAVSLPLDKFVLPEHK